MMIKKKLPEKGKCIGTDYGWDVTYVEKDSNNTNNSEIGAVI